MFRQLRDFVQAAVPGSTVAAASNFVLTTCRPLQISEYLELRWGTQQPVPLPVDHFVGGELDEANRAGMARLPAAAQVDDPIVPAVPDVPWPHIIYAFAVENTRIVDVFANVISALASGETLPFPSVATQRWMRITEDLFFSPSNPLSVLGVTSHIRSDAGAVRRNAYYRLLGLDLNHGKQDGSPHAFVKPDAANREFAPLFEDLLREVWKAYVHRASVGPRAVDPAAIAALVVRLREMLNSRRFRGALSREEFFCVAMMSWLHLTVDANTQVVTDLSAQAESPAERLRKIGSLVRVPTHSRTDAFFRMCDQLSAILLDIENGLIETDVTQLYAVGGLYTFDMLAIITQWSIATGRDIKESAGLRGAIAPIRPQRQLAPSTVVGQASVAMSSSAARV